MEHPGKELKRLRELAGLSQYELATLCFIPRNRLSLFECGYCAMRDEDYEKAERVLQQVIVKKHKSFEDILSRSTSAPVGA
jgi:transcriptional regulator with XRE-family HTH domain